MNFHLKANVDTPLQNPLVLGHFLPWYTLKGSDYPLHPDDAAALDGQPELEDMRHWNDSRAVYKRTHLHMPEIGVYDSRDPEVITWQIKTALAGGVCGFILNWYGKYSAENMITLHWLRGLERWNKAHPDQPFCYFLSYDMQAQWPTEGKRPVSMEEDFAYIRDYLLRDACLMRDGKPLFMVFPYGDQRALFRRVLDSVFGPNGADLIWSGSPGDKGENACFAWIKPDSDSMVEGSPYEWSDPDNCGFEDLKQMYADAQRSTSCEYIVHGAWPGFNTELVSWAWNADTEDSRIRPRVMCRETRSGSTMELIWEVYLDYLERWSAQDPEARIPAPMVQLVTWNDYAETSTIEPSRDFGDRALQQCLQARNKALRILEKR